MFPDIHHATIHKKKALECEGVTETWYENEFIPLVQKRGAEIIKARGASSAASAANAAIDHIYDWIFGLKDWVRYVCYKIKMLKYECTFKR